MLRMKKLKALQSQLKSFAASQSGTTAIEYALIATLISVSIVGAVGAMGSNINNNFYSDIVNAVAG